MAEASSDINQIIEQIVCTALLSDIDYQKLEDKAKRKIKFDQQTESVNESISNACKRIEDNLPNGEVLPNEIRVRVANQLLIEVTNNPYIAITDFKVDEKKIIKELDIEYDYSQSEIEIYNGNNGNDSLFTEPNESDLTVAKIQTKYGVGSEKEKDIIDKAHSEDATQHDKDMYVALSQIDLANYDAQFDIKFEDKDEHSKGFLIKTLKTLKEEGNIDDANVMMQQYGITEECLKDSKWNAYEFLHNTKDSSDAEISRRIRSFSDILGSYARDYDKYSDEKKKEAFNMILELYEKSQERIDFGLDSLSEVIMLYEDKINIPEVVELTEKLINDINDESQNFEVDKYSATRVITLVNKLNESNPEYARQILNGFNERAKKVNYSILNFDDVCALRKRDIECVYCTEEDGYDKGKDAYEQLAASVKNRKIDNRTWSVKRRDSDLAQGKNTYAPKTPIRRLDRDISESIMNSLNSIYERDGMEGVMRCMQATSLNPRMDALRKKDWLLGFARFIDTDANTRLNGELNQHDMDVIANMIKNLINENAQKNKSVYKFIQLSNNAIKGKNKQNVITAENLDVETVIDSISGSKMDMFASSGRKQETNELSDR